MLNRAPPRRSETVTNIAKRHRTQWRCVQVPEEQRDARCHAILADAADAHASLVACGSAR
jgi:hypothetical protein